MASEVYVGRVRSLVTHSILSLLTLGVYSLVWYYLVNHEMRKNLRSGMHPAVNLVIFLLVPVIGWFVMAFLSGRTANRLQRSVDADKRSSAWYPALWSLIPLVGWTAMAACVQAAANRAWLNLHGELGRALQRTLLECPECTFRFERLVHPFKAQRIECPSCRRAGDV